MTFEEELQRLINRHSYEVGCGNTPDFILAKYINDCLQAFTRSVRARERWYGFEMQPGQPEVLRRAALSEASAQ